MELWSVTITAVYPYAIAHSTTCSGDIEPSEKYVCVCVSKRTLYSPKEGSHGTVSGSPNTLYRKGKVTKLGRSRRGLGVYFSLTRTAISTIRIKESWIARPSEGSNFVSTYNCTNTNRPFSAQST